MTAGSVDDGKSTLIGRLFHDQGLILKDQLEAITQGTVNLAHFTDGLRQERQHGITIDVAYRYFESSERKFIVADVPGHAEFTRNMVTAATQADACVILVDGDRVLREGLAEQTRRHSWLCQWLGIKHIAFLVNKMDLLDFSEEKFADVARRLPAIACSHTIPLAALQGDNVVGRSSRMPWFRGPTVSEWVHSIPGRVAGPAENAMLAVQYVTASGGACGTLLRGPLSLGPVRLAGSPEPVQLNHIGGTNLSGGSVRVETVPQVVRGDLLIQGELRVDAAANWEVEFCWLADAPARFEDKYRALHLTGTHELRLSRPKEYFDFGDSAWKNSEADIRTNEIYRGMLSFQSVLQGRSFYELPELGRLVLVDPVTHETVAAVLLKGPLEILP